MTKSSGDFFYGADDRVVSTGGVTPLLCVVLAVSIGGGSPGSGLDAGAGERSRGNLQRIITVSLYNDTSDYILMRYWSASRRCFSSMSSLSSKSAIVLETLISR